MVAIAGSVFLSIFVGSIAAALPAGILTLLVGSTASAGRVAWLHNKDSKEAKQSRPNPDNTPQASTEITGDTE